VTAPPRQAPSPAFSRAGSHVDNMTTKVTTIDLSATVATYVVNVWNTGTLSFGTHTVRIQWSSSNTSAAQRGRR
jgi:hypothetical protein